MKLPPPYVNATLSVIPRVKYKGQGFRKHINERGKSMQG